MFFVFKQKTAYEMRISDWSSDVCSSDLQGRLAIGRGGQAGMAGEGIRQPGGILDMAGDPQLQGLESLQQDPGIERAERRPGMLEERCQLVLDEGLGAEHPAATAEGPEARRGGKGGVSQGRTGGGT